MTTWENGLKKFVDSLTPDQVLFLSGKLNDDLEFNCKQLQEYLQNQLDLIDIEEELPSFTKIAQMRFGRHDK